MSIVNFIDLEPIKFTIFSLIVMILFIFSTMPWDRDAKFPQWGKYILIFLLFIPLIAALVQKREANENIHSFIKGENLICKVDNFTYKVSKAGEWGVEHIYFSNESSLIRADNCEELY